MTMTRTPAGPSAGGGTDPGHGNRGPGIAGFSVRLTAGGYGLAVAALLVGGLSLPVAAPGWPPAAYLAAAAAVTLLFLISMVLHQLAHAVAARRHGIRVSQITVGLVGGATHGRYDLPGPCGRIVRALTWARTGEPARAGLVSARAGQITGAIAAAAGLGALLLGHPAGLWIGLVGVLAITASRAEARRLLAEAALSGLLVRDIVPRQESAAAVPQAWQTVQAFLDGEGDGRQPGLAGAPSAGPIRDFDGRGKAAGR